MNTNKIVPIWRKEHKPPTVNKYYKTRWCNSIREKKIWQNLEKCGYAHNNQELRKTPEDPYPEEYLKKIQDMYKNTIYKILQVSEQWYVDSLMKEKNEDMVKSDSMHIDKKISEKKTKNLPQKT